MILLTIGLLLSFTEATGVTQMSNTVIKILSGEGTLVVEVDDPSIEVSIDGEELSVTGAGLQEFKLRPGQYRFTATKDGQPVEQKLISISRGGREVVRVSREANAVDPTGTLQTVRRLRGHTAAVTKVLFFDDNRRVLTSSHDLSIRIWDVSKEILLEILPVSAKGWAEPVALSPDQRSIALEGDPDGSILIYDIETRMPVRELTGHNDRVGYLEFSPDGKQLLSRGRDSSLRLWDITSGEELQSLDCEPDWAVRAATFSRDGTQILYADEDQLILWDIETQTVIRRFPMKGYPRHISQVVFSPNGHRFVASTGLGDLLIWNVASADLEGTIDVGARETRVAFSPDGEHLITSSRDDQTLRVWSLTTLSETQRLTATDNSLLEFAVSRDGQYIVAGGGIYFDDEKKKYVATGEYRLSVIDLPDWEKP